LARLRGAQYGIVLGLVLGTALLEIRDRAFRRRHGLTLRHEIVAAVTRLHVDLVAEVAEVLYFLQQNELHGVVSDSLAPACAGAACVVRMDVAVSGCRSTAAATETARGRSPWSIRADNAPWFR